MNCLRTVIRAADRLVNLLIILYSVLLLLYGIYAVWDSAQINRQADSSNYETYKPAKSDLSFEELRKLNPELFGWLTVYGTQIDYPIAQAEDNSKYVNTDAKGQFSLSGNIFLDCRNDKSFKNINNIIYGHHMEKKTMFGELESFSDDAYFEKHPFGALYYENAWHGIEFFAFLHADAYDSVLYNTGISGGESRHDYLTYIREHATNFRNLDFNPADCCVTLSTCTSASTNGRHLLIGRITEKPKRKQE